MKTITEFPGMNLKNAAKTQQELVASGKTPEEIPGALGEALKLEGQRLEFLLAILETVGNKLNNIKRAIVYAANEGEKPAGGLVQKGDHFYAVEYYPPLTPPGKERNAGDDQAKNNRDGKRGGKRRDGKGRGDRSGSGRNASPRAPRAPQPAVGSAPIVIKPVIRPVTSPAESPPKAEAAPE